MHKPPEKGQRESPVGKVLITDPAGASALVGTARPVLVAGSDAVAVGEAVVALRAAGSDAAGWVGDPSDPAVREMALELFPGCEVVAAPDG